MKNFYSSLSQCHHMQWAMGRLLYLLFKQATQTKEQKSKPRPLLVTSGDHRKTKIQIGYKNEEIVSFTFLSLNPFPQICKTWIFLNVKEIYQKN